MAFEVPELLETNSGYIYNVIRLADRCIRPGTIGYCRAKRHNELYEIFIKREQSPQVDRNVTLGRILSRTFRKGFLIRRHAFAVEASNFKDIHRYTPFITSTGPLRVLLP